MGISSQIFIQTTCRELWVIMWYNFWMACPLKFGMAKNVKNPAQFLTTFDFDRKYLRNGSTNRKLKKYFINYNPSYVERKKLMNFGPQTKKLLTCILTQPSGHCSVDYISALTGWCTLKFLYALEIAEDLLTHTQTGTRVPQNKKKYDENLKFGLKFSACALITSGIVGIFSPNFSRPRDELWSTNEKVIARILIHPICSYAVSWSCKSIRHVVLFGVVH